jgi:hypothetical protein
MRPTRSGAFRLNPVDGVTLFKRPWKARWVWVRADDDSLRSSIRPAADDGPPPNSPSDLPAWRPADVVVLDLAVSVQCPRCGIPSRRFRCISDGQAMVCLACSRSFTVSDVSESDAAVVAAGQRRVAADERSARR